jgi:uroporphyrinogen-III synthase
LRFIVTRPEADARAVAQRLESAGHEVVKAPLMAIARRPGVIPQRRYRAVLITSANGARALADHPDRQRLAGAEAHAVGPASAAAMRAAGWGAGAVHQAPGDVAGLIAAVQAHLQPAEGPLLHVSGETVTGDLEGALARSGFAVDRVVLYAAEPARALPPTAARALTTGWADAVLLYSPRTAEIWVMLTAAAGLGTAAAMLRHLCLSEAVAKRIRAAFPEAPVAIAARPEEDAMAALALMTAAAGR